MSPCVMISGVLRQDNVIQVHIIRGTVGGKNLSGS